MENNNHMSAGRLAAALANTIRGAMQGGLVGAAAGAATSFLPELIKIAAVVLCTLILLPTLVLAALPNILFGYDSAGAGDIIDLTNQARTIDAAYREVENYNQAEIDRLVEELKASYTGEEGPAFDRVDTTTEIDNTNIYWFIAITSAAHHQDLYSMSPEAIKSMTIGKLTSSATITVETEGEGEAATTMRTLKIDIKDLDPDALMRKLGFTEEEETWARVLYSTLSEEQTVGVTDSDGEGYYDTDYGDIVFSDAATPVVYYNQTDSRWGNKMYGKSGTIGTSGCGPTALAIVVSSLTDRRVDPLEMSKWAVKNGYRCEGNGSYHSLMNAGATTWGITVTPIGRDAKKLVEALKDGKLVVAIMSRGHFTSSGHFIVLRGVTSEGKILVADPASVKRSGQEWALGIITNEASGRAGAGGPFWVMEVIA